MDLSRAPLKTTTFAPMANAIPSTRLFRLEIPTESKSVLGLHQTFRIFLRLIRNRLKIDTTSFLLGCTNRITPIPFKCSILLGIKDRFGPNRGILLSKDYYRPEVKYDGIGGYPLPTCSDRARYEYGVAMIPDRPPYDHTRLHQLAPMWDQSVRYHSPEVEAREQPCQNIVLGDPVHHPTLPPWTVSGLGYDWPVELILLRKD